MFSFHLVGLGTSGYKCGQREYSKEPICRWKSGFFFLLIYEQNAKFKKEEKGSDFGGSQSLQLRGET